VFEGIVKSEGISATEPWAEVDHLPSRRIRFLLKTPVVGLTRYQKKRPLDQTAGANQTRARK
jgi:hypothetical protein